MPAAIARCDVVAVMQAIEVSTAYGLTGKILFPESGAGITASRSAVRTGNPPIH